MGSRMNRPRVMIVVDMFPPVNTVGVHRTLALCRRCVETGWEVTVITSRPGEGEPIDQQMLAQVPASVRVVRTASPDLPVLASRVLRPWKRAGNSSMMPGVSSRSSQPARRHGAWRSVLDWFSLWLHIPDGRAGWLWPALAHALKVGRTFRPQVIYSSAPRWTSHVVGAVTSMLLHSAFVADFRDPWCGSAWRGGMSTCQERVDTELERMVVKRAMRITCAWEGITKHLARRYSHLGSKMVTILNGFDHRQLARALPIDLHPDKCVLMHAGLFYGPRSPVALFEAIGSLRARHESLERELHIVLVGATTFNGIALVELARREGIEDMITVMGRIGHMEALGMLKGCDVAMLFGQSGSDSLASVPAKTFELVGAGKPVLAVGAGYEVMDILNKGGCKVWSANESLNIAKAIEQILQEYRRSGLLDKPPGDAFAFSRLRTGESLERVLREVIARPASQSRRCEETVEEEAQLSCR